MTSLAIKSFYSVARVRQLSLGGSMTLGQFLDAKWGDIISLAMLATGLASLRYNQSIGLMLIGSGMTGLKLKTDGLGNNATQKSQNSVQN